MLRSGPAERSSYGENITVEYERVYQAKSSEIIVPQSHAVASRHNYSELTGYTLLHLAARLRDRLTDLMRVRRLPPFTYLSFYIPFYTQDPHMDLRGARRFFASCAGPRLGLQSLCLLMSLRCCLCSPSALEPRTLALPFFPALLSLSHLASAVLQPCADLAARAYCYTGVCWRIACPGTTRTPSRLPGVRPRWRRY